MKFRASLLIFVSLGMLAGCSPAPTERIIIVSDWHYVSRDLFAAELLNNTPWISDAEIDKWHSVLKDDVEKVQNEQVMILRGLIREHGIKVVFKEGVSEETLDTFRQHVREFPADVDLSELQRRMEETDDVAERALLLEAIDAYRTMRMQLGAVGQLLMSGELEDVLPLDDETWLLASDPMLNEFRFDSEANQEREREMVRRLIKGGPVVVAVLGGAHNLADKIKATCPRCVYQRITPEAYKWAVERRS